MYVRKAERGLVFIVADLYIIVSSIKWYLSLVLSLTRCTQRQMIEPFEVWEPQFVWTWWGHFASRWIAHFYVGPLILGQSLAGVDGEEVVVGVFND